MIGKQSFALLIINCQHVVSASFLDPVLPKRCFVLYTRVDNYISEEELEELRKSVEELRREKDSLNNLITLRRSNITKDIVEYAIHRQKEDVLVTGFLRDQNPYKRQSGKLGCLFTCSMLCWACSTCCGLIEC